MKKSWIRRYTKYILVFLNVLLVLLFLMGCLLPWFSSQHFWLLGFIGVAMPYLVGIIFFCIIFWLFVKKKFALYLLLVLCLGYKQINVMFAWHTNTTFKKVKANYNVRIISWNIANMSGKPQKNNVKKHTADEIVNSLLKQNADVICLQEFEECKSGCKSVELIKKKYPYYYFPGWNISIHRHLSGNVIFSKYPIIQTDTTRFINGTNVITANVVVNEDTISLYTTHLDSYRFSRDEFKEIDDVGNEETMPKKNIKGIASKMKNTFITHCEQADVVEKFMENVKYPSVFCGDLNEIANNNVYWKIRGDRQDAFLQKGFGFGKTFNSLSPVLRIDYIMPDNNFEVTQFTLIDEEMSDHKMLVADLMLKKYQVEKTKN